MKAREPTRPILNRKKLREKSYGPEYSPNWNIVQREHCARAGQTVKCRFNQHFWAPFLHDTIYMYVSLKLVKL